MTPQHRATNPADSAAPEPAKAAPAAATAALPAEPSPTQFLLRLAAQRSSADAKTLAERVKREHAADVGGRGYKIDEAVFGSMGKFYRANVGPFADLEGAKSLCASIRAKGVDCEVISR